MTTFYRVKENGKILDYIEFEVTTETKNEVITVIDHKEETVKEKVYDENGDYILQDVVKIVEIPVEKEITVTIDHVPTFIREQYIETDRKIIQLVDGGFAFEDEVNLAEEAKHRAEKEFNEAKQAKLTEIKNAYLEELYAPVWFEQTMAQPNGETGPKAYVGYDTDQDSQIDFNSSYKRAQLKGSTLYNIYVNPDNLKEKEFTYHTPEMFDNAILAAGEYQEGVYVKYYTVKAQVEAATTKEELEAIQWT